VSGGLKRAFGRIIFSRPIFEIFQKAGIHITRRHFYSPIPDTRDLAIRRDLWEGEYDLPGVDLNPARQLEILESVIPKYITECNFPEEKTANTHEYYVNNGSFGLVSAVTLHGMIRHFQPRTIIEVGSGFSTLVSARAALMNKAESHPVNLIAVEPFPSAQHKAGFPGLTELIPRRVEDLGVGFFERLQSGDILFIDSSHVLRIGGDVAFLYLEVLPRLKSGVVVHIHDILWPRHYARDMVINQRMFWNEQYLLQAFLAFNHDFEVLMSASWLHAKHPEKVKAVIPPPKSKPKLENYVSSSFWMRRVG
jgi:predicted O-methyltransferase YrrM